MHRKLRSQGIAISLFIHAVAVLFLLLWRPILPNTALQPPSLVTLFPQVPLANVVEPVVKAKQPENKLFKDTPARLPSKPASASAAENAVATADPAGGKTELEASSMSALPAVSGDGAAPAEGALEGVSGSGLQGSAETGSGAGAEAGGGASIKEMAAPLRPEWIVRPTDAQMLKYNPYEARRKRISGKVTLSCLVDEANRARKCRVTAESPRLLGFGNAARALSHTFRIRPPIIAGRPSYDAWVTIDIHWENE